MPPAMIEAIAQRAAEIVMTTIAPGSNGKSPYLTVAEASEYLRCSPQRIYDLRSSGRISRLGDGTRALVCRAELDALVQRDGLARRDLTTVEFSAQSTKNL
jgi:excisionase family DNA binding protein